MEKAFFILKFIVFCSVIVFAATGLLVLLIKLISMAFRRTKKLNVKKIFIILYTLLSAGFWSMTVYSVFFEETIDWVDLGNDYQYLTDGADLDFSIYGGDGIFSAHTIIVFPKIIKYKTDSNYITVKQKYSDKLSVSFMEINLMDCSSLACIGIDTTIFPVYDSVMYNDFRRYYEKGMNTPRLEHYADSVVSDNPYFIEMKKNKYNYYIIDKIRKKKMGPLSKTEFDSLFVQLHLSKDLKLK